MEGEGRLSGYFEREYSRGGVVASIFEGVYHLNRGFFAER